MDAIPAGRRLDGQGRGAEAALSAAKDALQVHGALGYTWEQDLHVWMRRAWTLDLAWGDGAWHRGACAAPSSTDRPGRDLRLHGARRREARR